MLRSIGFALMAAGTAMNIPKRLTIYRQAKNRDTALQLFFNILMSAGFTILALGHFWA